MSVKETPNNLKSTQTDSVFFIEAYVNKKNIGLNQNIYEAQDNLGWCTSPTHARDGAYFITRFYSSPDFASEAIRLLEFMKSRGLVEINCQGFCNQAEIRNFGLKKSIS